MGTSSKIDHFHVAPISTVLVVVVVGMMTTLAGTARSSIMMVWASSPLSSSSPVTTTRTELPYDIVSIPTEIPRTSMKTILESKNKTKKKKKKNALARVARQCKSIPMTLRGGSSYSSNDNDDDDPFYQNAVYTHSSQQQQQQQQQQNSQPYHANSFEDDDDPFHETVQDRVDRWREQQMQYQPYGSSTTLQTSAANMGTSHQMNPQQPFHSSLSSSTTSSINNKENVAETASRLSLFLGVSKGARAVAFFVLVWRNIVMFDVAETSIKQPFFRLCIRSALTLLLCGNIAGFVASILAPAGSSSSSANAVGLSNSSPSSTAHSHSSKTKKRMKAILNLDKLVEIILLAWFFFRLTIFPSKYVPKEVFIAGAMHSIFILLQCQATTRFIWDEGIVLTPTEKNSMSRQQNYNQQQQPYRRQDNILLENDVDDTVSGTGGVNNAYQQYASYDSSAASGFTQ